MSTIKIYTGIGIFDSDNDLIAQGAQQLKFEGFCTVTKVADQTVVDIGLGNIDGGVKFTGSRFWLSRNKEVFRKDFEISEENYEAFLDLAIDKCGEEYGFLQTLGIKLNSIFAFGKNIFSSSADTSNCSELIFAFKDFVKLDVNSTEDLVTPRDIIEACRKG